MAGLLIFAMPYGQEYYGGPIAARVLSVLALVGAGGLTYAVLAWVTGAVDREKINLLIRKKTAQQGGEAAQNTETSSDEGQ